MKLKFVRGYFQQVAVAGGSWLGRAELCGGSSAELFPSTSGFGLSNHHYTWIDRRKTNLISLAMAHQTSRLHRLLTLLDTGSTMSTRRTAARQIGEIAKQHQGELQSLLQPVRQYLRSKSWDTRVAAAHAIGAIAENVMHLTVHDLSEVESILGGHPLSLQDLSIAHESNEIGNCGARALTFESNISIECENQWCQGFRAIDENYTDLKILAQQFQQSFDIQAVLDFGALLLSSGGHEYDVGDDIAKSPTERLLHQKRSLRRRLGLDGCEQFMDVNDMICDEDLIVHPTASTESGELAGLHNSQIEVNKQEVEELVANMVSGGLCRTLSARERNVFKRKAKVIPKDVVKEWGEGEIEEPMAKRGKRMKSVMRERIQGENDKHVLDVVSDDYVQEGNNEDSPFGHVVELLVYDMFDPVWEVRHGSLMALREVLRVQATSAGVAGPKVETDIFRLLNDDNKEYKNFILSASARKGCMLHLNVNMLSQEDYRDIRKPKDGSLPAPQSRVGIKHSESTKVTATKKASAANMYFLQDCTIRLLCVFALDRFGDYVSDQVVAPVRETCAQVLGAVLKQLPSQLVHNTLSILLQMQNRPEWEVRHGSMLGIKYLVAVRQEMLQELLQQVLPACMAGLEDADDDVRAVAAEALTPAASTIVRAAGANHVTSILVSLWDILLDLDDLSPSTSSVMHLLAELYSQPELDSRTVVEKPLLLDLNQTSMEDLSGGGRGVGGPEDTSSFLSNLAPRLWLFMRHNISTVRLAAIRTLERLLQSGDNKGQEGCTGISWVVPILGDALQMVFQNLLLDSDENVLQCSQRVWRLLLQSPEAALAEEAGSYYSSWLNLASTGTGASLEMSKLYSPNLLPRRSSDRASAKCRAGLSVTAGGESSCQAPSRVNKIREHAIVVVGADGEKSVVVMRVVTAHSLGILAASLPSTKFPFIVKLLTTFLFTSSAIQRQVASMVIVSWFKEIRSQSDQAKSADATTAAKYVLNRLLELLVCGDPASPSPGSSVPYSELVRLYAKMRGEAGTLKKHIECIGGLQTSLVNLPSIDTISAEAAVDFTTKLSPQCRSQTRDYNNMPMTSFETMELCRQQLLGTAGYLQMSQSNLHLSVLASVAGAVVWMGELPIKLNPIIQPLMSAIKREQEDALQQPAAEALAEVIVQCLGRKPSPNEKLIRNLCCLVCADPMETPKAYQANQSAVNAQEIDVANLKLSSLSAVDERARFDGAITRRGAESVLRSLSEKFKSSLFDQLPKLWDCLTEALGEPSTAAVEDSLPSDSCSVWTSDSQALITNLQVVRSIAPVVDSKLHQKLLSLLPAILTCVKHEQAAVRLTASRCITSLAQIITEPVMALVLKTVVPMLGNSLSTQARQGAGILIAALVEGLGPELVAYAPLLVIPLLGCMSDPNCLVRQSVTKSFAALVPLLPLARGVPPPKGLDESQASKNAEDSRFLEQLLDNNQVDDYKLCVPVNVTLRRYQQEGINWLAFLKRFKLHGILCDDMGLGKTLQASAIVASDTTERANTFAKTGSLDVHPLPSLVICPSTLVAHWAYEIEKFIPSDVLNPLQYVGSPQERLNLQAQFSTHNIILTSYDILRKDIIFLSQQVWNYCILDEGHIIKSSKSKITLAAKQIQADHRLILSGTPIQNNVLELWSLFDFLMPGFLGTERQFQSKYGKPLLAAREGKCTAKEAEAGVLAMEALHKQVMPFVLRRTKDKVLSDLPPKIIQDRYCNLSALQLHLYEDFSRSQARKEVSTLLQTYSDLQVIKGRATSNAPSTHVFQALQYLRKLCSHPLLVLEDDAQATLLSHTIAQRSIKDLHDLQHAPKLQALREILEECGIGTPTLVGAETPLVTEGGQHRVLVFAQLKSFLDIIEKDLLQTHMKGVTYLRLDGSVETEKRFDIVKAFNSDPTIDVLLLTTHVGGLGLNLTAADTVVFMEHDWNPMRDLQAMDRAHRLGQHRAVNVYRLIMHGTLEEKIMSLQRFKVSVANTVINAENSSLSSMDTTQLLDLFTVSANPGKAGTTRESREDDDDDPEASTPVAASKGLKAMLSNLEELWDQSQYTEEYNLKQFVARLNSSAQ